MSSKTGLGSLMPRSIQTLHQTLRKSVRNDLHVFGIATEDDFCAVAYVVIEKIDQNLKFRLVTFKARVAPIKHHEIPKLELMAAKTGKRLKDSIINEILIHFHKIYLWSDFTTDGSDPMNQIEQ